MHFRSEEVETFKVLFEQYRSEIRNQPGCTHLELWQSTDEREVFFTYSFWQSADDLERYRHSDTFKTVWPQTRVLFAERPQAWSVNAIVEME